jgi:beta-xylosidase
MAFTWALGFLLLTLSFNKAQCLPTSPPSNPFVGGWYADPDVTRFGDTYWVYATVSIAFKDQKRIDAFSSPDLLTWTKYEGVFTADGSQWAESALWAPSVVERNGKYYIYYSGNDPSQLADGRTAGVGVAVADRPQGPFFDAIDRPLIGEWVNRTLPMDQQVFVDDDGQTYLIWGNGGAAIAKLSDDMVSLGEPFDDGQQIKNITPDKGYFEGPYMLKHEDTYYFQWSEGAYGTPDYRVAYAKSKSLLGPYNRIDTMLVKDNVVADGPGHHAVLKTNENGEDKYLIFYHRRILGDAEQDHRVLAYDTLEIDNDGISRVRMT